MRVFTLIISLLLCITLYKQSDSVTPGYFLNLNSQHMNYDDLVPLYKILCLALIFLVPLAPAWGLYKIAPTDKFLAKGTFSGFRINATGAAAIYIVLFSAIVFQTSGILKDIDTTDTLMKQVKALQNEKRPWKIQYKLTLMTADSSREIDPLQYDSIVKANSIECSPGAFHLGDDNKTFSFFAMDGEEVSKEDPITSQVIINGYSTRRFTFPKNHQTVDSDARIITLNPIICLRNPNSAPLSQINVNKVLGAKDGSVRPPSVGPQ